MCVWSTQGRGDDDARRVVIRLDHILYRPHKPPVRVRVRVKVRDHIFYRPHKPLMEIVSLLIMVRSHPPIIRSGMKIT